MILEIPNINGTRTVIDTECHVCIVYDSQHIESLTITTENKIVSPTYLFINTDTSEQGLTDLEDYVGNWISDNL